MNARVKIVKRSTLELPQRSDFNQKPATVSSDRETAVIIKGWIAEHDQRRRLKQAWHWETFFKLERA